MTIKARKYGYGGLLLLLLALRELPPADSHTYRNEAVIFDCSELGCLVGRGNRDRCRCGPVNLAQELPCEESRPCDCGFERCNCPKTCGLLKAPCTSAQECKSGQAADDKDKPKPASPDEYNL